MSDTPKKRGRPRKPDDQLKRPRAKKAEEAAEVELEVEQIEVGDTLAALSLLDESEQEEIRREGRRVDLASNIAEKRWIIAKNYHRIENGQPLNFDERPFLIDIYKDPAPDLLIHGSAQFGKPLVFGTQVLTENGWVEIQDLKVGDRVYTPYGELSTVLGVFPQGVQHIYRMTMTDGRWVDSCSEHFWEIHHPDFGVRRLRTREVAEIVNKGDWRGYLTPVKIEGAPNGFAHPCSVVQVEDDEAFCIMIDDPNHLFVVEGFLSTGNTEWMICDLAASAGIAGLKVLFVTSKQEKRNKFVSGRIDPCFNSVPMYKKLFEAAQNRAANADSTGLKHFGAGSINFLFANASAKGEFTSWPADKYMVDEHQECDSSGLIKLDDRLSGSQWKFKCVVGHPSYPGSPTLQNLDFLYQHSDQRRWYIQCKNCGEFQELDWWANLVEEVRSEQGAILSVQPRDKDFISDANGIDLKPICVMCKRPMNRLTRDAYWKQLNPGAARHGYRLSNLCNVNERLCDLYTRYLNARHLPEAMFEFYTKQLGICYTMSGTQITEKMLRDCTTGDSTGIRPYSFVPVNRFNWRQNRGGAA